MSLNNTPAAERVHIGIFGRRNAGKSSLINALTSQNLAIVSDVKGTTTDPVAKSMELLPLGPVVLIDTPGLDDTGDLGALRVQKAHQTLNKTDIAILVVDASSGVTAEDQRILSRIREKQIPCLVAVNKSDLDSAGEIPKLPDSSAIEVLPVSAKTGQGIEKLKERIAALAPKEEENRRIVGDLLSPGDLVCLVIPIDKAAPKGRLILPQQQTIRDILDTGALALAVRDTELKAVLEGQDGRPGFHPALVITDSQAFASVASIVPPQIPLTSFSILFARYKGSLKALAEGARALDTLKKGDHILVSEGCTHHRQCGDIGTVKLPALIRRHTGLAAPEDLRFSFTSGTEFPEDLSGYRMVIHCGGCMLNEREMKFRMACARDAGVPMTNYGTAIAHMNGILERSLAPFAGLCPFSIRTAAKDP
ncbi:[FeFe] hydrogenase H-cluster maturation GTPase HydF [Lachnospiraceae bacterium DSM 108991]|uniref:[FeFe] hydrogenase H-cluster maturation GTPase HydF n=1 Tax=Claveliimonas monacensis TaxID=2779351 RepID=A0ABR9RHS2_9FIRM|nr:[FeFe] hydrogenase H-cluster maturation GTPase HydF [Claveliimonas monacensis]MBE5062515.1 [FeFe] hydrogenase H-cluster maturation GTPase HydF [Claveliimonas monacensis]